LGIGDEFSILNSEFLISRSRLDRVQFRLNLRDAVKLDFVIALIGANYFKIRFNQLRNPAHLCLEAVELGTGHGIAARLGRHHFFGG